jgi:Tol biopolymer transport system component
MRRIIVKVMLASLVAVAVAGGAWVLGTPSPASAEFTGKNGRIAFMKQDSAEHWQIWVANQDLKNQVKLTSESADSGWAVWKPGGAKLAFDSDGDIFKMNPDGTGVVNLTDSDSFDADAGWSPNGKRIAFDSDRRNHQGRQEIYTMAADGTDVHRVSTLPAKAEFDLAPRFSPDGKRLVFTRYKMDPELSALFTIRIDGSGLRQLTPWGNGAGDADWAPDGNKIVFEANPEKGATNKGCHGEIYTVDPDGQHLTNLTDNHCFAGAHEPVWSPDGTKILFLSAHAEDGEFGIALATMNTDGTERHFITPNPGEDQMHQPDWESVP